MAENEEQEQPLISHLVELRNRLLKVVLSVLLVFLAMTPFANEIYSFLAKPLMQFLPEDTSMVAIDVVSPFLTPFKLVLVASIFIAIPVILYQFWAFVAPGLYAHERRMIAPLLIASTAVICIGHGICLFCSYFL